MNEPISNPKAQVVGRADLLDAPSSSKAGGGAGELVPESPDPAELAPTGGASALNLAAILAAAFNLSSNPLGIWLGGGGTLVGGANGLYAERGGDGGSATLEGIGEGCEGMNGDAAGRSPWLMARRRW